jgi:DNA-binding winged helix-turn-helix (wHTH) protein/Tol biopolymer transport system component
MDKKSDKPISNFSVGDYTVVVSRNLLFHGDVETSITPKVLSLLIELAKHQGQTLSKDHLIIAIWGTVHTTDMVLSRAMSDLRKALGDSARKQDYIETVSKQGYRLKKAVFWQSTLVPNNVRVEETPSEPNQDEAQVNIHSNVQQMQQSTELKTAHGTEVNKVHQPSKTRTSNEKYLRIILLFTLLASFSFIAWFLLNQENTNDTETSKAHQLIPITKNQARESYIRFSKDGNYLVYSSQSKGELGNTIKLHSLTENTSQTIKPRARITSASTQKQEINEVSYNLTPVLSADNKNIAYRHQIKNSCYIRLYNLSNNTYRNVAECPFSKTNALDWSPDGKYLVTPMFNYIKKIEGLTLIDIETGKSRPLLLPEHSASGYLWPRFSPDGKSIAVVYYRPSNNLWSLGKVSVETGVFTEMLSIGEEISQVVWNEAGDAFYYLLVRSANQGIWKFDFASKQSELVKNISSNGMDFNDKQQSFAYIERHSKSDIWHSFETSDGTRKTQVLLNDLDQTDYPSLSPDNNKLAFISTSVGIDSLWLRLLDENSNTLLLQSNKGEKLSEPTWSPDAKLLLISVASKNAHRIIQFNIELGNVQQFQGNKNVKMGKWSQDGSMIYWHEEVDGLWQVMEKNLASGKQRAILSHPVSRFEISDKNNLYYQMIGTGNIHTRLLSPLNPKAPTDKLLLPLAEGHSWDAHLNSLYFSLYSKQHKAQMLTRLDLNMGITEALYPIKMRESANKGRYLSVSKDGKTAYYTRRKNYETDVVLMKL